MNFFSLEISESLSARKKTLAERELEHAKQQTEWYTTVKQAEFEKWLNSTTAK